jgi:hypothetical protein
MQQATIFYNVYKLWTFCDFVGGMVLLNNTGLPILTKQFELLFCRYTLISGTVYAGGGQKRLKQTEPCEIAARV